MSPMSREEFIFKFDGPALERHEIEVSLLADSLVAFRALAERSCKMIYGRSDDLVVKVKAGFNPGSFSVDLILDLARDAAAVLIPIGGSVRELLELYRWAKGKIVKEERRTQEGVQVKNCDGEVNIFNQCTFNLYQAASVRRDVDDLTRPLDHAGVDSISLSSRREGEDVEPAPILKLEKRDREFFQRKESGILRDDIHIVTLEIVTANLRGESSGWRFFDGELDFGAAVEDEVFLELVRTGQKVFKAGDMMEIKMRVTQRRPSLRLVTDRTIVEILSFIPAQDDDPDDPE